MAEDEAVVGATAGGGDVAAASRGDHMLSRVSTAIVQFQKEFWGVGPRRAKAYMMDDFLIVVMRGSQTRAERTMLQFGQTDLVRNFRQTFENEMTARPVGIVEDITGRTVAGYQSQIIFEPEVVIELFFFDESGHPDATLATAEAQLHGDPDIGEAEPQQAG